MFKIWAKIIDEDRRIVRDYVLQVETKYKKKDFDEYIYEICQKFELSMPVIIENHRKMYDNHGQVRFLSRDFVEHVDFFCLSLESGD